MKNIIEKCMENSDDRFSCFSEIIDNISETRFYQMHQKEIECRLQNAKSSVDYKCTIADLVENYFLGEKNALKCILNLLSFINYYDNYQESEEDIIETIFEAFEFYSKEE